MADSVNPYDIPAGQFPIVAGYVDGIYAWPAAGWKFHDASLHFTIAAVTVNPAAMCLDIESGAMTPAEGAQFVQLKQARGELPYLYFSESRLGEVRAALAAAGLDPDHSYMAWIALWDGVAALPVGWNMKQYANPTLTGKHYDLSVVADYLPGLDALPAQPPASGPGASSANWSGLQAAVDVDLPGFSDQLASLTAGVQGLG